jgi:membrane protease YdiL (CAAX protease family)
VLLVVLALFAGLAAAIWNDALPWPDGLWFGFLMGTFPVLMLWRGSPPEEQIALAGRTRVYYGSAATLWIMAVISVIAASRIGYSAALMGWRTIPASRFLLWSIGVTLAALLLVALARAAGIEESQTIRALLPRTRKEKIAFAVLCISAGICEETTFRSFLIPALAPQTDSYWLAAVISSIVFGILHAYQRVWGAVRAGVLGFVLALPFILTGSVLPSIVAHTALDLIAGLVVRDRLLGDAPQPDVAPA